MILRFSFSARPLALCAGLALLVLPLQGARSAADAFKLYSQKQYAASADAFEEVVKSSTPDARLYYYAGLANRDAGRPARARQIFQHLINSFSGSPEAPFAQQALNGMNPNGPVVTTAAASAPAATASSNQPPSKDASTVLESAHHRSRPTTERKKMAFVFTPQDIARDGAEGVDQTNAPNCWFESSMAALASLPKEENFPTTGEPRASTATRADWRSVWAVLPAAGPRSFAPVTATLTRSLLLSMAPCAPAIQSSPARQAG